MIVVTGGAGFIGSVLVSRLNKMGYDNIIIVDHLGEDEKWKNLNGLDYMDFYHKDEFYDLVLNEAVPFSMEAVIHLGACSSTTEKDADYLMQNNFRFSKELVKYCLPQRARFIYASSAATYGDGSSGYKDDENEIEKLRPLNMYGYSKQLFDMWLKKMEIADKVVGLKFFNVYGPNEYHKGDMRSVVHKAFEQISGKGEVNLFKSYKPEYKDGEQMRDFIYVNDAVDMILHFLEDTEHHGLFNVGTGKARTWNDLVAPIFKALDKPVKINYTEMPEGMRDKYQYHTEADISKLRATGYNKPVTSLEDGIKDYVENYLLKNKYVGRSK